MEEEARVEAVRAANGLAPQRGEDPVDQTSHHQHPKSLLPDLEWGWDPPPAKAWQEVDQPDKRESAPLRKPLHW